MSRSSRSERRRYNPISPEHHDATAAEDGAVLFVDDDAEDSSNTNNDNLAPRSRLPRTRQYSRVSAGEDRDEEGDPGGATTVNQPEVVAGKDASTTASTTTSFMDDDEDDDDDKKKISVTILDFAQSRFQVQASPSWTIARFKQMGYKIHKVVPSRQRLIFRGKMLEEDQHKTLRDYGIAQDGTIIHLFPKPRVVITNSNNESAAAAAAATGSPEDNNSDDREEGARVPTIVMDAAEAERRSQILVLGSTDFIEAVNSVKIFSFMLLIISSIELLNLTTIAMGAPQPQGDQAYDSLSPPRSDDFFYNNPTSNYTAPTHGAGHDYDTSELTMHWGPAQYVDTVVSVLGVYVALLGLRASTENTSRLARIYLLALFGVGTLWLLFNFFFTAAIERKIEEQKEQEHAGKDDDNFQPLSDSDIYNQAFQVMILPGLVWSMCCMRAWQFQHLLREAEAEAEDRIQTQINLARDDEDRDEEEEEFVNRNNRGREVVVSPQHDEELALSNNNAVLT